MNGRLRRNVVTETALSVRLCDEQYVCVCCLTVLWVTGLCIPIAVYVQGIISHCLDRSFLSVFTCLLTWPRPNEDCYDFFPNILTSSSSL